MVVASTTDASEILAARNSSDFQESDCITLYLACHCIRSHRLFKASADARKQRFKGFLKKGPMKYAKIPPKTSVVSYRVIPSISLKACHLTVKNNHGNFLKLAYSQEHQ
jgi:hypothetical protein